jgi:hypothetical protein
MTISQSRSCLTWANIGDLHITQPERQTMLACVFGAGTHG